MIISFSQLRQRGLSLLMMTWLAAFSCAISAADGDEPFTTSQQLTPTVLAEAVLLRNPGVKALEAAARAAEFRIAPAGALDDPSLSYFAAPDTADGPRGLQQRLEVSQPIPWPGKRALREEAARQQALEAITNIDALRVEVTAAAKFLSSEWAYVHRALAINAEHQALLQELRSVAEARYAAGRVGQQDALQAEVERARLETDALTLERRRSEVQARINALLNRSPEAELPLPSTLPEPIPVPPMTWLQQRAVLEHPVLERLRLQIVEAQVQTELAEKDFYPDFRLMAGYNSLWDSADKRWTVGIGINLPLDYGNKRTNTLDAKRADLMQQRWQLTDREAQLLGELESARAAVEESKAVIELYRSRLLPLAQDNLSVARADYRAGAGSFLNIIDAEREQLRTENSLARSHADYWRRRAELERWLGIELDKTLPQIPSIEEITP